MRDSRYSLALRALLALTPLAAAGVVHAQNITVTAANASNDAIYSVVFSNGGGTISVLNTDQGSLHHLTSLVFYANHTSYQLDLLAADNQGGLIVRYPGDFRPGAPTTGTVIFAAGGAGPQYPDALSVDAAGNLFVVNDKQGGTSLPQLWVLPGDNAGGFGSPVLLDANFGSTENLQETLIVGTTINTTLPNGTPAVLKPGDLLVLTDSPATVQWYSGSNGHGPVTATVPTTLINLPVGTGPGGIAFWPADNSLLISTSRGTILQYQMTPSQTPAPAFASGLGNGQFKIKTGIQFGLPYAYVANNNGGTILEFGGPNQLLATVTTGVQHPQGLAVTNVNYAPVSACQNQQTGGCDLLGGKVITHDVASTLSLAGNVVEDVCVVQVDPRLVNSNSCTTGLPVATVCGAFGTNVVIPASLCGSSGPTQKGFALVKTLAQAYATPNSFPFNGTLVANDTNLPNVLPPAPGNPVCNPPAPGVGPSPLGTVAWAPLTGEGTVVEGTSLLELTSGCDGSTSRSTGLSIFGIGLGLNTGATGGLVSFAAAKYGTLLGTIQGEISENVLPQPVSPAVQAPDGNFTFQLQQCINESQAAFTKGSAYYAGAANQLLAADQQVAAVATLAAPFTANSDYPNPSGALRSRLENMYYTINTRLDLQIAAAGPPSPPPAPPSPSISGTPVTRIQAGSFYSFQPGAADFAGDIAPQSDLTFSIVGKPSWATFHANTGLLSGIAVTGPYPGIVITVTDGCASASLPAFSIRVY
ncbi:MAG: hypothetical protein PVSMB6_20790 [Steroidobacteraceae bacterium]